MNKKELYISGEALQDLEAIWNKVAKETSKQDADTMYTHIISDIRLLSTHFSMGKTMESVRDGYRYLAVKDWVIFYRTDRDHCVEVIRVL